ncbi:hypothetical protein [Salinicola endophyticus]|uniref:hypothetical protein n=1 Tax=Salinicola endophyticus TaxID=1949083 RepID=UPI000DA15B04|nr:hypothetical protein [Salinicola endophyticus]
MGMLQIIFSVVMAFVIPLAMLFFLALMGLLVNRVAKQMGLRKDKKSKQPPGWGWLLTVATLGPLVWVVLSTPSVSELRHAMDKFSGYNTTRIILTLREDTPEARAALVELLTPLMRIGVREIKYQIKSRYGSHLDRDEVPSFYRFDQGKMDIVMGGVLPGASLYMTQAALEAVGTHVPSTLRARLELHDKTLDVVLLPPSIVINTNDAAWGGFLTDRIGGETCSFSMEMRIDLDAVWDLLFGHTLRSGALNGAMLRSDAGGLFASQPLKIVGFSGGHIEANPSNTRRYLTGRILMRPDNLDPTATPDCGRALVRWATPGLRAALLNALPADLDKLVSHASIEPRVEFSPWYSREHWQSVVADGKGRGQREACTIEDEIQKRFLVKWISTECNGELSGSESCLRLDRLREAAFQDVLSCTSGVI